MARQPPPDISRMTTLKVDNVGPDITVDDLKDAFQKYGDIGDVYIPRNFQSNQPRGFAFVRFTDARDADNAIAEVDGKELFGREVRVAIARDKKPERVRDRRPRYDDRRRSRSPVRRRSSSRDRRYGREERYDRYDRGGRDDRYYDDRRSYRRSRSRDRY